MQLSTIVLQFTFLCFLVINTQAQEPILRHFTVEDGLPSSHVYEVIEDREGFIWVGTDQGLSRFDGYEFKTFTVKDGLPSNDVWNIAEDAQGRIWLGTFNELCYIEDGEVKRVELPNNKTSSPMISQIIDENQMHFTLFNHPEKAIYIWDQQRQAIPIPKESYSFFIQTNLVIHLNPSKPSVVESYQIEEVGTGPYSIYLDGKIRNYNWDVYALFKLTTNRLNVVPVGQDSLYLFTNDSIFIGSSNGIQKLSIVEHFFSENSLLKSVLRLDSNKIILLSGNQNIVIDNQLQIVDGFEYLKNIKLHYAFKDSRKNLWLSTSNGIYLLGRRAQNGKTYLREESQQGDDILSISVSPKGKIWMGSRTGKLLCYTHQGGFKQVLKKELVMETIRELLFWPRGYIGLGGDELIIIPVNEEEKPISNTKQWFSFKNTTLKTLSKSDDGRFWAGFNDAIRVYEANENKVIETERFSNKRTYALAIDQGHCWIGRKTGLWLNNGSTEMQLNNKHPVFAKPINDLIIDRQKQLWIATDGFGLYRFDGYFQIDTIKELSGLSIKSLYVDEFDRLWVGTNQGVKTVRVLQQKPLVYEFSSIDRSFGIPSFEINDVVSRDSFIYVATRKGVCILDERKLVRNISHPILRLLELSVDGNRLKQQDVYKLSESNQDFTATYVGLDFQETQGVNYHYRLFPFDKEWKITQRRQLDYPVLPAGQHALEIKASDINNRYYSQTLSIPIHVSPVWYKTWHGILAIVLSTGLLFWLVFAIRVKNIQRTAEKQVEQDRRMASLELHALQAQMDPHFVFNALQSIQDFIFNKDERAANRYIVKFSRLMRLFLESSKEKQISLADEISLIRLYIELEHLRFTDKFDYKMEVDEQLRTEEIMIPSMMIQPFVENAINRGLIYKTDKGQLVVSITLEEQMVKIEISDNGIGRHAARKIKETLEPERKSRGMQLVRERQQLLNLMQQSQIEIQVKDLSDEQGKANGTTVVVKLPIEQKNIPVKDSSNPNINPSIPTHE